MTDISVYVLKPFPFSRNGIVVEHADVSTTIDLPGRLFDGLNGEGYVRRAVIGDGRIALHSEIHQVTEKSQAGADAIRREIEARPLDRTPSSIEVNNGPARVVEPAPQPPAKTAELAPAEAAALTDGSWKTLKYFAKKSIAAKLSDQPITDGATADAAIEAYLASKSV
jgi:hypothetical protein